MMKKRTGLSTAQRKLLLMWVMCGSLLLGAACGTMCTLFHPTCKMTQLLQAPNAFLLPETGAAFSQLFGTAFPCSAALLAAAFLLGFSMIGQPLAWCLLFYLGGQVSAALLQLLCHPTSHRYFFCIGLLLPFAGCAAACLLFAVRESLRFSGRLIRICFSSEEREDMRHQLQLYCIRFLVLLGLLLLASILYSLFVVICMRMRLL